MSKIEALKSETEWLLSLLKDPHPGLSTWLTMFNEGIDAVAKFGSTQRIVHRDCKRYFFDTEFMDDGKTIELISIGVVCSDGREYYAVSNEVSHERANGWVREHVLPQLPSVDDPAWKSRTRIGSDLTEFIRPNEPFEVWAYFADYDWIVLCQLFGSMLSLPKHFPHYCMDLKQYSVMVGSPQHPKQERGAHNALEDARWNQELYKFLRNHG